MKVVYTDFGDVRLTAEDGRDSLFLKQMITGIPKEYRGIFSEFIQVSLDTNIDSSPADDILLSEAFFKNEINPMDTVTEICFNSIGIGIDMKEEAKKLLKKLK